jgi:exosortase C (VPDSG-CTERM-specific)
MWPRAVRPATGLAAIFFAGGLIVLVLWLAAGMTATAIENYLAPVILSFLLFFVGVIAWCFGKEFLKTFAFPVALLVFMIPFPTVLRDAIDTFLQHGSAAVANGLFVVSNLSFYKEGLIFHLPGINIRVASECSGIHSTLALLITSLLAGYLFLRKPWNRAILALVVIPLALLRNGFRIFVIGQLCAQIGPQMIDSPIHHHGGPIFFILSLIPFFLLLVYLIKFDRRHLSSRSN